MPCNEVITVKGMCRDHTGSRQLLRAVIFMCSGRYTCSLLGLLGVLILRRARRRAIWAIIVEQGELDPL